MEQILDSILEVLKKRLGPEWTYYFGDPITFAQFAVPAVAVAPGRDYVNALTMGARGKDKHDAAVQIVLARSAREGFGQNSFENEVDRKLIRAVDGYTRPDGTVVPGVVSVLREDISLGGSVLKSDRISVQYAPAVKGKEALRVAKIEVVFNFTKTR